MITKKSKKNFLVLLFTSCFILATTLTAVPVLAENTYNGGIIVEEVPQVDLSNIDPQNIIDLSKNSSGIPLNMDKKENSNAMSVAPSIQVPDIKKSDLEKSEKFLMKSITPFNVAPYTMSILSDIIPSGENNRIYTYPVAPGKILNVELNVPHNLELDYDLYLFEIDNITLEPVVVSLCRYNTDSNFMNENVSAINTSSEVKVYYIMVLSKGVGSDTEYFTLKASMSNALDNDNNVIDTLEPNDNLFYAVDFPSMNKNTNVVVMGSICSPIDNDWFALNVEDISDYAGIEIGNIPDNVVIESYIEDSSNCVVKTGTTKENSVLPIQVGRNYFRIYQTPNSIFKLEKYEIRFAPALTPTKVYFDISVNGYCQRTSSLFADRKTRFLYTMGSNVVVRVMYLTADNILTKTDDTVTVTIDNPSWSNPLVRYREGRESIQNQDVCSVSLNVPPLIGDRFDWVYTTIKSEKMGYIMRGEQMALLSRYDDGETTRPCRHNGACGLR